MASINLSGILTRPDGEPDVGAVVKFTHFSTTGTTVKSSYFELIVPPNGSYNIDLEYGNVRVDYSSGYRKQDFIAYVIVNQDNPATSIPELLNADVPPTDDQLLEFQTLLADATGEADRAEAAAVDAEQSAADAEASLSTLTSSQVIMSTNMIRTQDIVVTVHPLY